MYKILNNYTAPTLKESFHKISEYQKTYNLRNTNTDLACVTAARGRKNEALGSVCASAPNSVLYNLFQLFAISNACSE